MNCNATPDDNNLPLKGLKVLVVEDNAMAAFELARLLTRSGAEVVGPCATSAAAEAILAKSEIGFALVDLRLSDHFADDLIGKIRQRAIPFALVTGNWTPPSNADEGAVAVLLKPYNRGTLINVLARYAPRKRNS